MDGDTGSVLLIDEDRGVLQRSARVLERAGFACVTMADPGEAMDRLQGSPAVDVVLLEPQLQSLDGIGLMRGIRDRFAGRPWLQLIVLTGAPSLTSAIEALRLEAADYLQKPVAAEALVQGVRRAALRAAAQRSGVPTSGSTEQLLRLVWQIHAARRAASPEERLPEASWEMLSELMALEFSGRRITVGGLCLAASCPVTTALRRIEELVDLGFIAKDQDPADARRQHVRLTDAGRRRMERFLGLVSRELGAS